MFKCETLGRESGTWVKPCDKQDFHLGRYNQRCGDVFSIPIEFLCREMYETLAKCVGSAWLSEFPLWDGQGSLNVDKLRSYQLSSIFSPEPISIMTISTLHIWGNASDSFCLEGKCLVASVYLCVATLSTDLKQISFAMWGLKAPSVVHLADRRDLLTSEP